MNTQFIALLGSVAMVGALVGCGEEAATQSEGATPVSIDRRQFVLDQEPDGAVGVIAAKEEVENGAALVLVGRIGGAQTPWVDGRAAFTLIDASMSIVAKDEVVADDQLCTEGCCDEELRGCTTLVKFVDASDRVVPVDSRELLGVDENDMVVIQGKAKKDETGNFSMLATGLYIRK